MIAVKIIREKTKPAFQRHELCADGEGFDLLFCKSAAGRNEALGKAAVERQIKPDL